MNVIHDLRREREAPPLFHRETPGNSYMRLAVAQALALARPHGYTSPLDFATDLWPHDRAVIELLTRGATAPAMTTVAGWAAELTHRVVMDGLTALGPASAAAEIFRRGLVLVHTGPELCSAPALTAGANYASFVAEGVPIPVRQLPVGPALINPHKIATIAVLTREMLESSNAETLITDALVQSVGAVLDVVLFDANPEDAVRPKGLRNGIAALTASTAADGFEAVFEDIAALVDAIAPVAGTGPYVIVGSPGRALGIAYRMTNIAENFVVLPSAAAGGNMYAIAPAALAVAMSPMPEVESVTSATLVMDTAPGDAGTMGPEKGMFQTDSSAVKVRWPISWVLRDARGFAWLTPTWK
jgi:hypothetical protein